MSTSNSNFFGKIPPTHRFLLQSSRYLLHPIPNPLALVFSLNGTNRRRDSGGGDHPLLPSPPSKGGGGEECGLPVAFGCIVIAIVWLLASNRSVRECLVCFDAISYGVTYYVRSRFLLLMLRAPGAQTTKISVYYNLIIMLSSRCFSQLET